MIVGIDYTAAAWQGAGIGRLAREQFRATLALGGPLRYVLFYAASGLRPDSPYLSDLQQLCATYPNVRAVPIPFAPALLTRLWQRLRLPLFVEFFTGKLDLVHAPDFVLPPTFARTLVTVHDLTFLLYPQYFKASLHRYLTKAVPRSLRRADLVLADSEATRTDLIRLLKVAPERVIVAYPGIAPVFRPLETAELEAARQRLNLPPNFLLFVGTLEPRKNLVRLLEAFNLLEDRFTEGSESLKLVLAGRKGWLYDDIFTTVARLKLESRVIFLDFVADNDLPVLYNLAKAFVYPSLYEGFGLPVAEALACGTPVVTAAVASLPEVAGDAAILVNPQESAAIAAGIAQALAQKTQLKALGPRQAQRFTWEQSAKTVLKCYNDLER